jgi:hypothetical protein
LFIGAADPLGEFLDGDVDGATTSVKSLRMPVAVVD